MDNRLNLVVQFGQKGLDKLQGGIKNLVGLGKSGSKAFRDMTRESRSLARELKTVERQLSEGMRDGSRNITELANRQRELKRSVEAANAELKRQAAFNEVDNRASAMRGRGSELISKGQSNVAGGAMMLAPLLLAGKYAADFSSGMVDIQQKAELSDEATARLRNNILASARASKQMPEDMRAAVDTLAGLGLSPEEAVKAASPMGKFMTAFKVDGTDAASSVYAGLNSLEIPLSRTTKLLDMMAAGGNQGAFEVKDMARAFPGLTAQMKALGQTGEGAGAELISALEIVRRGAGSSDEAATNMENLLAKLTATTTLTQFKKHGIDAFGEIERGIERGVSPLETMIALTRKATGGDPMKIGQMFPDLQAGKAMRQLMLDYDDFQKMKTEVGAAEGLTTRAFDQRVANDDSVAMRELGASMSNLVLSVAPVLLPFLRQVTAELVRGVGWLTSFAAENPKAAGLILKLVAGLAAGKIALGAFQIAFGGLLGPMATGFALWRKYKIVGSIAKLFPNAALGVRMLGVAFRFMLGPVGLAITLIGLVAYAVYANWDKIKAAFSAGLVWLSGAWVTFKAKFWEGLAFLQSLQGRFVTFGKALIAGLVSGIMAAPGKVWTALKNVVMSGVNNVKKLLGIASPSRLFMSFGGYMADGMALGIDRRGEAARSSARRLAAGVAGAAALGAGSPLVAGGGATSPARVTFSGPITITVAAQPGQSPDEIAVAVRREMEAAARRLAATERSSFGDG